MIKCGSRVRVVKIVPAGVDWQAKQLEGNDF